MPLVSVIIPAYQAGKYIEKCINSILAGRFQDYEILIVDDGSDGDNRAVYNGLLSRDKRICLISQEHLGTGAARNVGIENAAGRYIAFIDADDWVREDYLEKLVSLAERCGASWVACSYAFAGSGKSLLPAFPEETIIEKDELPLKLEKALFAGPSDNILSSCAMGIYRLETIRKSGVRFRGCIQYGEDLIFNYEFSHYVSCFGYIPESLYVYFIHAESSTGRTAGCDLTKNRLELLGCLERARASCGDSYLSEYLSYAAIQIRQVFQFDLLRRKNRKMRVRGYHEVLETLTKPELGVLWKKICAEYRPAKLTHRVFFSILAVGWVELLELLRPFAIRRMQDRRNCYDLSDNTDL